MAFKKVGRVQFNLEIVKKMTFSKFQEQYSRPPYDRFLRMDLKELFKDLGGKVRSKKVKEDDNIREID